MIKHWDIPRREVPFWRWLITFMLVILAFQVLSNLTLYLPEVLRLPSLILMIAGAMVWTYQVVYYQLASYHYAWVDHQLVCERLVGRSNHAFLLIKPQEITFLQPWQGEVVTRRDRFFHGKINETKGEYPIYLLVFSQGKRIRRILVGLPSDVVAILAGLISQPLCQGDE